MILAPVLVMLTPLDFFLTNIRLKNYNFFLWLFRLSSIQYDVCTNLSKIASVIVASPIILCQLATGRWLAIMVEDLPCLSAMISIRSRCCFLSRCASPKLSSTSSAAFSMGPKSLNALPSMCIILVWANSFWALKWVLWFPVNRPFAPVRWPVPWPEICWALFQ